MNVMEHVTGVQTPSLKNIFQCLTPYCPAIQRDLMWDDYGGLYANSHLGELPFIDGNNAPFGTFQRKCYIEVYKHDEDFYIFSIGNTGLKVSYSYKGNEDGEILGRKWKLDWIWKGCYYISGIKMLFHTLSMFHNTKNQFIENKTPFWHNKLMGFCNTPKWDKRWWKKLSSLYVKLFYRRLLQQEVQPPLTIAPLTMQTNMRE